MKQGLVDTAGMRFIEGGSFLMGAARFYPEERPVRTARVEGFWIDESPVTNSAFARFVADTGYLTSAERSGSARGSLVFVQPIEPPPDLDPRRWWRWVDGACWRQPLGPQSTIEGLAEHPVVHVSFEDALAYARWCGKALPTETQWEFAARGGLQGAEYAWGHELAPDGSMLANFWQGEFPHQNTLQDGWERTSPVGAFPSNGFGLFDMIGNVWEWTADLWSLPAQGTEPTPCCSGGRATTFHADPAARRVIKGGSYLCARNYCQRYRPAARQPQAANEPTGHLGFRCVVSAE